MLKTIDPLLTGQLLQILADMGHGDELVLGDANFPAAAVAQRLVQLPGHTATSVLQAVLSLLPLDDFVEQPAAVMACPDGQPAIYSEFTTLIHDCEGRALTLEPIDRFQFYDRAKLAYAVVSTGERRLYGNIILKKGVIRA